MHRLKLPFLQFGHSDPDPSSVTWDWVLWNATSEKKLIHLLIFFSGMAGRMKSLWDCDLFCCHHHFIAKSQSHKLFILPTIPENDEQMDQSRSEAAFHTTQVTLLGSGTEWPKCQHCLELDLNDQIAKMTILTYPWYSIFLSQITSFEVLKNSPYRTLVIKCLWVHPCAYQCG